MRSGPLPGGGGYEGGGPLAMIAIPQLEFSSIDVRAFRSKLLEWISVFHEIDLRLQERVVDYLINGHDVEVLLDLRESLQDPNRPNFFKVKKSELVPLNLDEAQQFRQLFNLPVAPDGYYQRLGQVCSQYPDLDRTFIQPDARMPMWFNSLVRIMHSVAHHLDGFGNFSTFPLLDSLNDQDSEQLLRLVLEDSGENRLTLIKGITWFKGLSEFLAKHLERLLAIARAEPALQSRIVVTLLHVPLGVHLAEVIDYGLVAARTHAVCFESMLKNYRADAKAILLDRLNNGEPAQRKSAAQWLDKLYGESTAAALGAALAKEKDRKVYAAIDKLYSVYRTAIEHEAELARKLVVPKIEMPTTPIPLPAGFMPEFEAFLKQALAQSQSQYKIALHNYAQGKQAAQQVVPRPALPSRDEMQKLTAYMEGNSTTKPAKNEWLFQVLQSLSESVGNDDVEDNNVSATAKIRLDLTQLHLLHVLRLLDAIGSLQERSSALAVYHVGLLNSHRQAQSAPYGLRELDAAAQVLFARPHLMSRGYLINAVNYQMEDAAIWPAFVDQFKLLEDSIAGVPLDQYDRDMARRRTMALDIAAMFPMLPHSIAEAAWQLVFSDGWTLRPLARPLMKRQANCRSRAIAALADRRSGARMGAAELLAEMNAQEAIEPLKQALRKEKLRPVQGPLLSALEKLNANLDEFIDREQLLAWAKKGVKLMPRCVTWFPFDKLPPVHWSADGQQLDPVILTWWLVQCVEFKSMECSPVMRIALQLCRREDTVRLARFIIDAWIEFDTWEPDNSDMIARYRAHGNAVVKTLSVPGQDNSDIERHVERLVNVDVHIANQSGSAWTERGMLALVGAFGDTYCIDAMEKYLLTYRGDRHRQAKAMLEVLPQMRDPRAREVLQRVSNEARTPGLGKRAQALLEAGKDLT